MPRPIGAGSWPLPGEIVRNVPPTEFFASTHYVDTDWTAQFPLALTADATTGVFDVLTPAFQGRGQQSGLLAGSPTRGLGSPGSGGGSTVAKEYRVPALTLDLLCFARVSISIRFRWIYSWLAGENYVDSYPILPVRGVASYAPGPTQKAHVVESMRIMAPWFRLVIRNESLANISTTDFNFFLWLRGA